MPSTDRWQSAARRVRAKTHVNLTPSTPKALQNVTNGVLAPSALASKRAVAFADPFIDSAVDEMRNTGEFTKEDFFPAEPSDPSDTDTDSDTPPPLESAPLEDHGLDMVAGEKEEEEEEGTFIFFR